MAYTSQQLTMAWTAVHNGLAPDAATQKSLDVFANFNASGQFSDADTLSYVLNSADDTTAVALLTYQFFTGKSPTKAGVDYLVHSDANPSDLSDAYYAKFNIENRYINFAANLGVNGDGAKDFAAKYGAMSFGDYVASIYETIIGATYAKAAGVDVAAAVAYLVGTKDAVLATARDAGMITPNMTSAQVDLAVKAAMAGLVMAAAVKADIGIYAASANNVMLAMAQGKATYGADLVTTYGPASGLGSTGTGKALSTAPSVYDLPGGPTKPVDPPKPPVQPPVTPDPDPDPGPQPLSFTLTSGDDHFTGDDLNDTFNATPTTFNSGDVLNGGFGSDTLRINATGDYALSSATLSSIETVAVHGDSAVTADVRGWAIDTISVSAPQDIRVWAGTTTDVVVDTDRQSQEVKVYSGRDVTINAHDTDPGVAIRVGLGSIGGAVKVHTSTTRADVIEGRIEITGGSTIEVVQTASNAIGTGHMNSSVLIYGRETTTEVTVKMPKKVAPSPDVAANGMNTVKIYDGQLASSPNKSSIAKINVDGADGVIFGSNALSTVTLAHVLGDVVIQNASILSPQNKVTTLDLTVSGVDASQAHDDGVFTTLNVTGGAEASNLGAVNMSALTKMTFTGAGDLAADVSGIATLAEVNASASSGHNTVSLDGTVTAYVGGSGLDDVVLTNTTATTKAIAGGAGATDQVTVSQAQLMAGVLNNVTGFERLSLYNITGVGSPTLDLRTYNWVTTGGHAGGGTVTLNGLSSGGTFVILGGAGAGGVYDFQGADFQTGANDVLNLVLSGNHALDAGQLQGPVENVRITTVDTQDVPTGIRHAASLLFATLQTITVSGNAGLNLTAAGAALTSVDASGVTKGGFEWTSGALAGAATVKGSATGANAIDVSLATAAVTYEGGAGNDTVFALNSVTGNVVRLGEGTNYFKGSADSVTAGAGDDYIQVSNGGVTVNAGNGDNVVIALSDTASTITTGSGDDNIFVGGGANTVNVGSGDDYVGISAATATSTGYTTINGMGAGDKIEFSSLTLSQTTAGAAVATLGTYAATLTSALAGDGSTTPIVKWFTFGTDTYVVVDRSASNTFDPGVDYVVKVTGVHDLNVAGNISSFTVTLH